MNIHLNCLMLMRHSEIGSNFGVHLIEIPGFCKGLSSDIFHLDNWVEI